MSYGSQSADVLFNPLTDCLKLPLARQKAGRGSKRSWRRERVRHRPPGSASATIEGQVEWTSWHGGDGYGYVPGTGRMPPVAAGNPTVVNNSSLPDTRWAHRMTLPLAIEVLTVFAGDVPYLVFEQAGFLWVVGDDVSASDTVLWKIDPADGSIDATTILNATTMAIASRWVRFDGIVYILLGFGQEVWKVDGAGTVTEATDAAVMWKHAVVTRDLLFFTTADNEMHSVSSGADPFLPANWSGALVTGDDVPITELAALGRTLYIGREDGLNAFDTDLNLVNLIPELQDYRDATNCVGMIAWHGGLLVPHTRGLFFYTEGGSVQPVGPEVNVYNTTALRGQFRAFLSDGAWAWGVLDRKAGTVGGGVGVLSQEVVMMREAQQDAAAPLEFFELQVVETSLLPGGAIISAVSGGPRIYGVVDGGALITAPLLATTGAPSEAGTNGAYTTGVEALQRLPTVDMDQPLASKYLRSVEVDVTNVNASGREVNIYYAIDPTAADATLTQLGAAITAPGRAELNFPPGTNCRWVQLAIGMETESATNSPVVWRIALNYTDRIIKRTVHTFVLDLAEGSADREGSEGIRGPMTLLGLLEDYEDDPGEQVVLLPTGETINGIVLEVTTSESAEDADQPSPELQATVLVEEVP